jgi:hypothetical protein
MMSFIVSGTAPYSMRQFYLLAPPLIRKIDRKKSDRNLGEFFMIAVSGMPSGYLPAAAVVIFLSHE